MSDENEVQATEEPEYSGNTYDYSIHHAVDLWPLFFVVAVLVLLVVAVIFLPDAKHREQSVPNGKAYTAFGSIVDCQPISAIGNGPYRSFVRTPKDEFFSVYWRRDFQPPVFGAAIGPLKYHQCGVQAGVPVHCFDSFGVTSERVRFLDLSPVSENKK